MPSWSGAAASDDVPREAEVEKALRATPASPVVAPALELKEPEQPEAQVPDEAAAKILFPLKAIVFEGMDVYRPDAVLHLYESLLDKEVSLGDMLAVTNALTKKYRRDGYLLSQAVLPAQEFDKDIGQVRIVVFEGFIDRVLVNEGGKGPADAKALQRHFKKITASRPLNVKDLEKHLLAINSMAGTAVKTTLKASPKTRGAADLYVDLSHRLYDAHVIVDNRGTNLQGPERVTAGITLNSLLRRSESISGSVTTTGGMPMAAGKYKYFSATYREKLSPWDLSWHASVSFAKSSPEEISNLENLDVDSDSRTYQAGLSYPLIQRRDHSLTLSATMDYRDVRTDLNGAIYSEDRVPSAQASVQFAFLDEWRGANSVSTSVTKGLSIFDSTSKHSPLRSRDNGQVDFLKVATTLTRDQWLAPDHTLTLSSTMQFSDKELLSGDEFFIGGSSFLSAYDSGALSGENGLAMRAKLNRNKLVDTRFLDRVGIYGFFDWGYVWDKDGGPAKESSIVSTGAGAKVRLPKNAELSLEYGIPLRRDVEPGDDVQDAPRIFFSFVWRT